MNDCPGFAHCQSFSFPPLPLKIILEHLSHDLQYPVPSAFLAGPISVEIETLKRILEVARIIEQLATGNWIRNDTPALHPVILLSLLILLIRRFS